MIVLLHTVRSAITAAAELLVIIYHQFTLFLPVTQVLSALWPAFYLNA